MYYNPAAYLPGALIRLLLQLHGPAVRAGLCAMVHTEDNRLGQHYPRRPTAHDGGQEGLAAS